MKSKIARISIFILILLLIAGGIAFAFRDRIKKHFMPEVEQLGDIMVKVVNDKALFSSKITVENKLFLKIKTDTIKYKVSLFDKTYLESVKYLGIELPANGKDTIDWSLEVPYTEILKDMKTERSNGDSSSYTVAVTLQYSTLFGKSNMVINKNAKFKLPQPPELAIVDINYEEVHLKYIRAQAQIKIINHNAMALSISNMNYTMMVPDHGDIKGVYQHEISIKPKSETIVTLPIEITMKNAGKIIMDVITNHDYYNYTLTLNADLVSIDPVKESFHIDLTKSGKMKLKKK